MASKIMTLTGRCVLTLALALCAALGLSAQSSQAQTANQPAYIIGQATKVIDGHTIMVGGLTVQIEGVHTPSPGELFGHTARVYTERLLEGRELRCELVGADARGYPVARCLTGGKELGALVVQEGAALDCPAQSGGRFAAMESARARELITLPDSCR